MEGRPRYEGGDDADRTRFSIVAIQVVTGDGSRVPAILLANKCDLREESTVIISTITMMSTIMMMMMMMIKDYTNYLCLNQPHDDNDNGGQVLHKLISSDASYMQERDSSRVRLSL